MANGIIWENRDELSLADIFERVYITTGGATPQDKDEIYPQTRYILCHLLSEIFIRLGTLIEDDLAKLLALEEGYKRLVGVEILFLMKRKNCEVKAGF